ncbi:MAG: TPM domain-containing protein [Crocinitomicaceae bacterium]|jgi:uncharacterized protein
MKHILIIIFLSIFTAFKAQLPSKSNPIRYYNDFSSVGFLSNEESSLIEEKLKSFKEETSNQIVVVVVDDLNGLEASDFATRLGAEWGIGDKKKDNGIVFLIKPTEKRTTFISIGRGLEGIISDGTTKRIIDFDINPSFKSGNYYEGVNVGTDVLMSLAKKEFNEKEYEEKLIAPSKAIFQGLFWVGIFIYLFGWIAFGIDPKKGVIQMSSKPNLELSPSIIQLVNDKMELNFDIFKNAIMNLGITGVVKLNLSPDSKFLLEIVNRDIREISLHEEDKDVLRLITKTSKKKKFFNITDSYSQYFSNEISAVKDKFSQSVNKKYYIDNGRVTLIGFLMHLISLYFFWDCYSWYIILLYAIGLIVIFAIMFKLIQKYTILGRKEADKIEGFKQFLKSKDFDKTHAEFSFSVDDLKEIFPYAIALNCGKEWFDHYNYMALNSDDSLMKNYFSFLDNFNLSDLETFIQNTEKKFNIAITKPQKKGRGAFIATSNFSSRDSDYNDSDYGDSDYGGGDFGGGGAGGDW